METSLREAVKIYIKINVWNYPLRGDMERVRSGNVSMKILSTHELKIPFYFYTFLAVV